MKRTRWILIPLLLGAVPFGAGACTELPEVSRNASVGVVQGALLSLDCDQPLAGLSIRVQGTDLEATSDEEGQFFLRLEPGAFDLTVAGAGLLRAHAFGPFELKKGRDLELGALRVMPEDLSAACADGEQPQMWPGTPDDDTLEASGDPGWEADDTDYGNDDAPAQAEQGLESVATVSRGQAGGCAPLNTRNVSTRRVTDAHCDNAPAGTTLEDYVKGVVYGEVAIIQWYKDDAGSRLASHRERLVNFYKTFAVAARTYVVNRTGNQQAVRVDSGPNFQCYKRPPANDAALNRAVSETAGQYLVFRSNNEMLTSEYAASCHLDVTRPEADTGYVDAGRYIADQPRVSLRHRGLRQHNACGGHEGGGPCDGPDSAFNTTRNRRVRGVCQTGSGERAMGGADYIQILAHYQPFARVCGAAEPEREDGDGPQDGAPGEGGDVDGSLRALEPNNAVIEDGARLRFVWEDLQLPERGENHKGWRLTLRRNTGEGDGEIQTWHLSLQNPGRDRPGGFGTRASWSPNGGNGVNLRQQSDYQWWVQRLNADGELGAPSNRAPFTTRQAVAGIIVLQEGGFEGLGQIDATLVAPSASDDGAEGRVSRVFTGNAAASPYATLEGGPETEAAYYQFRIFRPLEGKYRLYVHDLSHPASAGTDIARNKTKVVVAVDGRYQAFAAPPGSYNTWRAIELTVDANGTLQPAAGGRTGTCDYRSQDLTCVETLP